MYPKDFKTIHIELTDKCQASCPMCARNNNGGAERPFVGQNEITFENFKNWFSPDFLKTLDKFYACGNYGDPIIAQDCLEIFDYVRECNPTCNLSINTNGSARTVEWWKKLAVSMKGNHKVLFGIDGFSNSHVRYRRGTNWDKIINNAVAFIEAGGNAHIDCLVFKHNENEIERFKTEMLSLGFKSVNFKYTRRFYNMDKFPVEDQQGNIEYYLEPALQTSVVKFFPLDNIKKHMDDAIIKPACVEKNEIYIDSRGNVFPCCWVGSDWIETPIQEKNTLQTIRNSVIENTKLNFSKLGIPNLINTKIEDINWININQFIIDNKPLTCVKNCNARI